MTVPAAHCEAKLHGFRRTQDGVVVSFTIHPQEIPQALALDPLGTRYVLAFAAIGDDEQPHSPAGNKTGLSSVSQKGDTISAATGDHGTPNPKPAGEHHKRSWYELPASQRAALLCRDQKFQKYVLEMHGTFGEAPSGDEGNAKEYIYWQCGIRSRAELTINDKARARFGQHVEHPYRLWAGLETEERS